MADGNLKERASTKRQPRIWFRPVRQRSAYSSNEKYISEHHFLFLSAHFEERLLAFKGVYAFPVKKHNSKHPDRLPVNSSKRTTLDSYSTSMREIYLDHNPHNPESSFPHHWIRCGQILHDINAFPAVIQIPLLRSSRVRADHLESALLFYTTVRDAGWDDDCIAALTSTSTASTINSPPISHRQPKTHTRGPLEDAQGFVRCAVVVRASIHAGFPLRAPSRFA